MRTFAAAAALAIATLAASPAPDQMPSLGYLVGSWECTYRADTTNGTYRAVYAYDAGGNWLAEHDTWAGGGDEGRFTYDPKRRRWIVVVLGNDRSPTVFEGTGDANRLAYRTVYPNANASETFDRVSPKEYTLHFTQTTNGQTTKSTDTCVKH